jgi:hypothetical protein
MTIIEEKITKVLLDLQLNPEDKFGFRSLTEAKAHKRNDNVNEIAVFKLSLHLEEALETGNGNPLKVKSARCPAWRADNFYEGLGNSYEHLRCNRSCFVLEKNGRRTKRIFCPACGYLGEFFSINIKKM